ncbi:MAG: glycosyltransferase [Proteobacteria bacterium]|nr:glycosyltransferase [Pseudomonadota bacterium]
MNNLSIIIVNYNSGSILETLVDYLLQTLTMAEVILVDNNSLDRSADFATKLNGVHLISQPRNIGFGSAANIGAAAADRPLLLFLNPDCFPNSDAISEMAKVLESDNNAGLCGARLLDFNGKEQLGGRRRDPTFSLVIGKAFRQITRIDHIPSFDLNRDPVPNLPASVEAVSGACMMTTKKIHSDLAGFDEKFFLHFEDLDYCRRVRQLGYRVLFVPAAGVFHYQGVSGGSSALSIGRAKVNSFRRYASKYALFPLPLITLVDKTLERFLDLMGRFSGVLRLTKHQFSTQKQSLSRSAKVLTGRRSVVLILGARSDIGESLCARLNALKIDNVCMTRRPELFGSFRHTIPASPDFFKDHASVNRIQVSAVISLCPIWELERFSAFLGSAGLRQAPWFCLSSSSVITKQSEQTLGRKGVAQKLVTGENWVVDFRAPQASPTTILRPTLIYGGRRNRNINYLKKIGSILPFCPNLSFATGLRNPVHCDDISEWIIRSLQREKNQEDASDWKSQVIFIQGGRPVTFNSMQMSAMRTTKDFRKIWIVHKRTLRILILVGCWLRLLREVPRDFVERLEKDFVFDNNDRIRGFSFRFREFHP